MIRDGCICGRHLNFSEQTFDDLPALRHETGVPYRGQAGDLPVRVLRYTCNGDPTPSAAKTGDQRQTCGRVYRVLLCRENRLLSDVPAVFKAAKRR